MSSSTMHLVLVTGMAGAGKSIALRGLEDAGYFCVDNLPVNFLAWDFNSGFDRSMGTGCC